MANPWFRMYSEFMHDPKVQMLSEQDQRRLVMLFCMRCNDDVTLQDKYVTFTLRISDEEWQETKSIFIECGFIDKDNNVLNWDKRQYISDSSAARVAKHRALHKTVAETKSNVAVTAPEQIQNRIDTDTDTAEDDALACPVEDLLDSYHRLMPDNPTCKVINAARRKAIKARWYEASKLKFKPFGYSTTAEGIEAWNMFFSVCAESDFLTGKVAPKDGHKVFFATVDFLFSPSGFAKCLENKYHE